MNVLEFDFDINNGFAWIQIEGEGNSDKAIVQCCLSKDIASEGDTVKFSKHIEVNDCGHNDGMCGDANEKAFKLYGEAKCMELLLREAKIAGIKVARTL